MSFEKICFAPFVLLILFLSFGSPVFAQKNSPEIGIYDGEIDNNQLIMVVEVVNPTMLKGYFVFSRGKAVEESHSFSLDLSGNKPIFQSDLYLGKMKSARFSSSAFEGIITLINRKKRFFFWRPKASLSFIRRPEMQVTPSARYQKEIFSGVEVKSNLLYGKAKGLWTTSPYSDAPYIEVLGKGLVKSFNDPNSGSLIPDH